MTRRAFAVVVLVVGVLVGAAVGATWYVVGGGSNAAKAPATATTLTEGPTFASGQVLVCPRGLQGTGQVLANEIHVSGCTPTNSVPSDFPPCTPLIPPRNGQPCILR
jgi:hypothetical protein